MAEDKYIDGNYDMNEIVNCLNKDFVSEAELCDYIENNIVDFCCDVLNVEYLSHVREYAISGDKDRRVKGNRRLDFYIKSKCGQSIVLECKTPKYASELPQAIGQCLSYITLMEYHSRPMDKIVIVSTKIEYSLPLLISRFNLPIGFVAFDKSKFLTYIGNGSGERK